MVLLLIEVCCMSNIVPVVVELLDGPRCCNRMLTVRRWTDEYHSISHTCIVVGSSAIDGLVWYR